MENRYNKAVERTALLEQELVDKARLEEELQRVKDELRGEGDTNITCRSTDLCNPQTRPKSWPCCGTSTMML
jgi:nuclear distribution protein NudE